MSMLPYEPVPQREGQLQSRSHCVLCVCWVFFSLLGLESPLWLSAQNALHAAPAHGAPRGALPLSGPATHHAAELPLWLLPDGRSLRWKGNPRKARWGGFKEQIPKLKAWIKYSRRTHHLKGKVSLQCISVWTSFCFDGYFPQLPWGMEEDENCDILKQSLRPDKWAKYYCEVNKRINCQWMHGTALP